MSKRGKNSRKDRFLEKIPTLSIEETKLVERCKFNFSFFCHDQNPAQDFGDWNVSVGASSLKSLLNKLKDYSKEPLSYWENERAGGGSLKVLEIYGDFPKNSDFQHPAHVPHDAMWGRFRMAQKVRLVGFVVPQELHGKEFCDERGNKYFYDRNTFYIVFLDKDHKFYKTEQK